MRNPGIFPLLAATVMLFAAMTVGAQEPIPDFPSDDGAGLQQGLAIDSLRRQTLRLTDAQQSLHKNYSEMLDLLDTLQRRQQAALEEQHRQREETEKALQSMRRQLDSLGVQSSGPWYRQRDFWLGGALGAVTGSLLTTWLWFAIH